MYLEPFLLVSCSGVAWLGMFFLLSPGEGNCGAPPYIAGGLFKMDLCVHDHNNSFATSPCINAQVFMVVLPHHRHLHRCAAWGALFASG